MCARVYDWTSARGFLNVFEFGQDDVTIQVFLRFSGNPPGHERLWFWKPSVSGPLVGHAPRASWPAVVRANERAACVKMSPVLRWTLLLLCALFLTLLAADSKQKPKKKKDIRDYNDADMARLLEQWEVGSSGASLCYSHVSFSTNIQLSDTCFTSWI